MTLQEFFFNTPIYTPVEVELSLIKKILNLNGNNIEEFHGYNPWKKLESTFVVESQVHPYNISNGGYFNIQIRCKRTDDIFHYYILWVPEKKEIMKTGQYPSVADFHISEIKQYKKLLSHEKLKEFTRAIGLAANGVGIGSFVYLRRIFEDLISEAYKMCEKEGTVDKEAYNKARMDEKIKMLSSHLPSFLVENKSMYSILSKGIHELDEKTCLAHFDTLRVGIEIILDEKLDELRKREKIEAAKKKLSQVKV